MFADPQNFESYRPLLFSIAYRMLGSAMAASSRSGMYRMMKHQ